MADFLPWFPFDFDDFMEGTSGWTWEERGAYLSLLREQWRRGWIPNTPDRLHFMVVGFSGRRMRAMWDRCIAAKFPPVEGDATRLANPRMAAEREKKAVELAAKRVAGAAGGAATARRPPAPAPAAAPAAPAATAAAAAAAPAPAAYTSHSTGDIEHKSTDTRGRADARVVYDEDAWGLGAWEQLWRDTLRRAPGDRYKDGRDRWRDLVERIGADAGLMAPPMAPAALAEALMRALPAYADHAGRSGERVPSVSVAAFEGWYATLLAWVERTRPRPQARGTAPAPVAPAAAAPPTAEELAATITAMQRLGFSGRQLGEDGT
jgi:uncharacterized protein YdaU (DUF1376 family)